MWVVRVEDSHGYAGLDLIERDTSENRDRYRLEARQSADRERWLDVAEWLVSEHWHHPRPVTVCFGFRQGEQTERDPNWEVRSRGDFRIAETDEEQRYLDGEISSLPYDLDRFETAVVAEPLGPELEFALTVREVLFERLSEYPDWTRQWAFEPAAGWPATAAHQAIQVLREKEHKRQATLAEKAEIANARLEAIRWRRSEPLGEVDPEMSEEQAHLVLAICEAADRMEDLGRPIESRHQVIKEMRRDAKSVRKLAHDLWVRVVEDPETGDTPLRRLYLVKHGPGATKSTSNNGQLSEQQLQAEVLVRGARQLKALSMEVIGVNG